MYWGLSPQQQPGSYGGGDDEMSVTLVEETGAPGKKFTMALTPQKSLAVVAHGDAHFIHYGTNMVYR